MILSDNHVHTAFSTDSSTPMEEMLQMAIGRGLSSICFTDHMDYDFPDLGNGIEFVLDANEYFWEMERLERAYPQIKIRRGLELGLKPTLRKQCNALTAALPFDFVIGSTHLVDDVDPYYPKYWEHKTEKQGLLRYYEVTLENIRSGIDFDVYGHIDYIVRYTPTQQENRRQGRLDEAYMAKCLKDSFDIIDEILRLLIANGKGIELNTAGLKYGLGHPHPHEDVIKRYHELGGELITVGSDGHQPGHLAYDFGKVPDILKACGFSFYTEFSGRRPKQCPL